MPGADGKQEVSQVKLLQKRAVGRGRGPDPGLATQKMPDKCDETRSLDLEGQAPEKVQ